MEKRVDKSYAERMFDVTTDLYQRGKMQEFEKLVEQTVLDVQEAGELRESTPLKPQNAMSYLLS